MKNWSFQASGWLMETANRLAIRAATTSVAVPGKGTQIRLNFQLSLTEDRRTAGASQPPG